jgi:hypothetical protein
MSNTDSFIEEVTEEVRRDRLFRLFRRYGWIALAVVVLIVGGASWNEWQKAQARNAAQALGDEILGALDTEAPDARAEALAALAPEGEAAAIARLLAASAAVEAGDRDAAIETLNGVATDAAAAPYYRDLAQLKSLILQTDSMAPGSGSWRCRRLRPRARRSVCLPKNRSRWPRSSPGTGTPPSPGCACRRGYRGHARTAPARGGSDPGPGWPDRSRLGWQRPRKGNDHAAPQNRRTIGFRRAGPCRLRRGRRHPARRTGRSARWPVQRTARRRNRSDAWRTADCAAGADGHAGLDPQGRQRTALFAPPGAEHPTDTGLVRQYRPRKQPPAPNHGCTRCCQWPDLHPGFPCPGDSHGNQWRHDLADRPDAGIGPRRRCLGRRVGLCERAALRHHRLRHAQRARRHQWRRSLDPTP